MDIGSIGKAVLLVQILDGGKTLLYSLVAVGAGSGLAALWHAGRKRVGEVPQDGRVVGSGK